MPAKSSDVDIPDDIGLREVYHALMHRRHGIISTIHEMNESREVPGLFVFNAFSVNSHYFRSNEPKACISQSAGSGAAFDRNAAIWATFGEVIERHAGSIYDKSSLIRATACELGASAANLEKFILFSACQYAQPGFRFRPPDADLPRHWVSGINLASGEDAWLPAQATYLGLDVDDGAETIMQSSSTGLAAGKTPEMALRNALCEVIERDAFASVWQLGLRPPRLEVDSGVASRLARPLQRILENGPLKIHLGLLPSDSGVAVVSALAENLVDGTITMGACANPDIVIAISKAVTECCHGYVYGRQRTAMEPPIADDADFSSPHDHLAFYLDARRKPLLAFLIDGQERVFASDHEKEYVQTKSMVSSLAARGIDTFVVDVTTDDVADLGFHVVRVLAPGLQPLLFGRHLLTLDTRRLEQVARHVGLTLPERFNTAPHPFP
jgi:ribosomal protein S12 methylthiotransferase accessory factor